MGIIRLLDEHLSNQIAAGEVVERPASVLKELIENAVDAGAQSIDVTAEEGGLGLIRVTDDGAGIQPDDLAAAFQRHATSKIASGKDLFQIATLGFRGEALPSIASVSKLRCVSTNESDGLGRALEIEGGKVKRHEDAASPRGTDMTVRELFYNTPARLKYMRTIQTELSHLSDVVYRQALARPDIAFTFSHNGTTLLRTPGNGDLKQVVAAIYGTAAAKAMLDLRAENADYAVTGLVAMPIETRANRNAVTVLVNGRYVRSTAVMQPLLQAYHTLLPINRYPLAVLHLRMHPSLVDVNVHPAKLEVRFSKENELRAFVEETVRTALQASAYIPSGTAARVSKTSTWKDEQIRFQLPPGAPYKEAAAAASLPEREAGTVTESDAPANLAVKGQPDSIREPSSVLDYIAAAADTVNHPQIAHEHDDGMPSASQIEGTASASDFGRTSSTGIERQEYKRPSVDSSAGINRAASDWSNNGNRAASKTADSRSSSAGSSSYRPNNRQASEAPPVSEEVWRAAFAAPPASSGAPAFPELHWVGQLHGTYLVAQNETGLYLIDQHAAHERIHYELFYDKFGDPAAASQELLLPVTLSFAPDEFPRLRSKLQLFEQAGVYLEEFGGNTMMVRAVPHWLPEGDEADIVREMAEWILSERAVDLHKIREKAAILCSCKASIKANQALTREAGETLIHRLAGCRQPYTCPHGRPIVVSFTTYELEKMFKRVMS